MITYQELYNAYLECYKNKKKSPGAMDFLFSYQANLRILLKEINERTYRPSPSTVFIITDPKIREVFAADFRDRIIHHLIIKELLPLFEDYFIKESFSCMPGRGTLYGIQTMAQMLDKCPSDWYVMKMDIASFFMNIRKSWLRDALESFIKAKYKNSRKLEDLVWLVSTIVMNDPTKNCIRVGDLELIKILPKHKSLFFLPLDFGLPIGNYSSQMFANFYMTALDYYVKYELGIDMYGRYVDDFLMFGEKDYLLSCAPKIRTFTKERLGLEVSKDKFYFQPVNHGVKFLGSMIMPGRIYCGNRVRGEFEKALYKEYPDLDSALSSFNSYLGLIRHYSSYNIRERIMSDLPNGWNMYFVPSKDYTKLLRLKSSESLIYV